MCNLISALNILQSRRHIVLSVTRLSHYDIVLFYLNFLKLLEAYCTHSVCLKKQSKVFCLGLLFSSTVKEGSGSQFGVRRDGRDRLPHRTHETPQVRQHRQVIFSMVHEPYYRTLRYIISRKWYKSYPVIGRECRAFDAFRWQTKYLLFKKSKLLTCYWIYNPGILFWQLFKLSRLQYYFFCFLLYSFRHFPDSLFTSLQSSLRLRTGNTTIIYDSS